MPISGDTSTCPPALQVTAEVMRFTANMRKLESWAVPNDVSILGHLNEWSIDSDLASSLDRQWSAIQGWWNTCLTTVDKVLVNQAVQHFERHGGVQTIQEQVKNQIGFVGNTAKDLAAFFGWITSSETWIRLGEVLAGAVLVLLALWMLFTHTEAGKQAKTVITKGAL
jgi:hypothetical protein